MDLCCLIQIKCMYACICQGPTKSDARGSAVANPALDWIIIVKNITSRLLLCGLYVNILRIPTTTKYAENKRRRVAATRIHFEIYGNETACYGQSASTWPFSDDMGDRPTPTPSL